MKKLIVLSMLAFVFILGAKMSYAYSVVMPIGIHPIIHPAPVAELIDEGSDPIIPEPSESVTSSGSNLQIILAGQCKSVEYTEWSACNKNFGSNGFQFRDIIRPTLGNCLPTGIQQSETVRDCQ